MPRPVRSAAAHSVARRAAALTVALAAAVGAAACGGSGSSSSSSSAPPTTGSTGSAATTTTTTMTTTVSASSSTTPQAVAGPPACQTADLHLSLLSGNGAAGTSYTYYGLTNTGANACSMIGYPGVSILDSHGRIVQHPATRGTGQPIPVRLVTLQPGQRARFLVNSTDTVPSPGCQHAYRGTTLQVYPPNQRDALLRPDNGPFCNLRVGPVQSAG